MEQPETVQISVKKKKEKTVNVKPTDGEQEGDSAGDLTDRSFRFAEQQELGKMVDVISVKNSRKENFKNIVSALKQEEE